MSKTKDSKYQKTNLDSFPVIQETEKDKEKMFPSSDDFIAKTEEEVIRVPNCTYANDSSKQAKYYLCPCSSGTKGFEPICEACAKFCHKNHHPTLEVPGINICSCGLSNHMITQEMENTAKEKILASQTQAQCFYSKFFEHTPNRGYYKYENVTYCAVCVEYCLNLKFDDNNLSNCDYGRNVCYCPYYHEINVIKLNADFISRKDFKKHMRNFNFNILFKIAKSKQIYLDTLINQINQYCTKKNPELNKEFFKNFIIYKILELFSAFAVFWENKFFHVVPSLLGTYKIKDLFNLMSLNELRNSLDEDMATNFITAKFYFAELLFNYIVRTFMLKYTNLWNVRTIFNMNLYQRYIHIHNTKKFYLFGKEPPDDIFLDDLGSNILDLYDSILKVNERFPSIFERIMSYVFPTFNRIMKYLIKYNIMNNEGRKRYFDLILETLNLHAERGKGNIEHSVFYIMKSVIYTTIYNNDRVCYDYFQGIDTVEKKGFMFQKNEESSKLTKIFLLTIKDFDRKNDISRTVIFDYYLRKFFEVMLDKEDFYMNSIYNCNEQEIQSLIDFDPENISSYVKIKNSLEQKYYDAINIFSFDLNNINRQYFSYDCNQETYFENANEILSKFHGLMINEGFNLDEISHPYCIFSPPEHKSFDKLQKIRKVIFYSVFFQKVEEFIHIYSCGKIYPQPDEGFDYNKDDLIDNINFLLKFLFLLANRDCRMLTFVMNIKPQIFAVTFNDVISTTLDFLERLSEMIYCGIDVENYNKYNSSNSNNNTSNVNYSNTSNNNDTISNNNVEENESDDNENDEKDEINKKYTFENFYFFSEVISELLLLNKDNLNILAELMRISIKSIKKITIQKSDFLNAIEAFEHVFSYISTNENIMERINDYFQELLGLKEPKKEEDMEESEIEEKKDIIKFIPQYYNFLCELYDTDIEFYNYMDKADIIPRDEFINNYMKFLEKKFENIPIEVEYALTRYYFTLKQPIQFQIERMIETLENLYMPDVKDNINLIHLSKHSLKDEQIPKIEQIIQIGKELLEIFMLYDIKKFNYYFTHSNKDNVDHHFPLKYYENIFMRPLFTLINSFVLDSDEIYGKDVYIFYKLVFYFLKNTISFYSNVILDDNKKGYQVEKLIYNYENFTVKNELTKSVLDDIYVDAKKMGEKIKYFELAKIFEIYQKNIHKIINFQKDESSRLISKSSIQTQNTVSEKIKEKTNIMKIKLYNIYKKSKSKTYDDNLSIIDSYRFCKHDLEIDFGIYILNYLQIKLFDILTDFNIRIITEDKYKPEIKKITKFKFQNAYILIYFNGFFNNDSDNFQEAFVSEDLNLPDNFFEYLIQRLIVGSTLNEVKKIYDIDFLTNISDEILKIGKFDTIAFHMGKNAIKFIQNLCEGHNKEFQSKFFEMYFDPEKFLQNNKNIYSHRKGYGSTTNARINLSPNINNEDIVKKKRATISTGVGFTQFINSLKDKEKEKEKEDSSKSDITTYESEDLGLEEEKIQFLYTRQVSFFNLICSMMKIINFSMHVENDFQSQVFKSLTPFKNYENIIELYTRYSDLIVEMIQGTDTSNFKNFYQKNLPSDYEVFQEDGTFENNPINKGFIFLSLANQIKNVLFDKDDYFNKLSFHMKYYLFVTMNNVLSQENIDSSIIRAFIFLFPPDKLFEIICVYLRGLYISHLCRINYNKEEFYKLFYFLELNANSMRDLRNIFKTNPHFYEDNFFKLASQMYLFLTIIGEKYDLNEAQKILKYAEKDLMSSKVFEIEHFNQIGTLSLFGGNKTISMEKVKPIDHNYMNDYIVTSKFFNKTIRKCEFKVENDDNLELKIIYFIVDPHFYYISKNNIENFLHDVDRSTSTTKLKSLIDALNLFMSEVEYKTSVFKKSKYIQNLLTIDYKNVGFYNFIISLVINFVLLLFLTGVNESNELILEYSTRFFVGLQVIMDVVFLIIFIISKYNFYVLLSKNELGKDHKLTILEAIKVYVFDAFLFNDEIYLLLLIIIMGIGGVFSEYGSFLFALQLLSIIKFVDTIKEIVLAFKIRLTQLVCMIGFLAILIFFYSNFGFYFLINEYNIEIEGVRENFCQNLLECTINFFNHGVRAGGGIGDIIEQKSFDVMSLYLLRWVSDLVFYITVILLLLNMINGVIVSTFSQIREESNEKEEDIKNKCFICNIDRLDFEKKKIDFFEHQKFEHNLKHYIKFFVYVKRINEKDLDADQSFIVSCLKDRNIQCFPVKCCRSMLFYK